VVPFEPKNGRWVPVRKLSNLVVGNKYILGGKGSDLYEYIGDGQFRGQNGEIEVFSK
jgi:hypothetical protein